MRKILNPLNRSIDSFYLLEIRYIVLQKRVKVCFIVKERKIIRTEDDIGKYKETLKCCSSKHCNQKMTAIYEG